MQEEAVKMPRERIGVLIGEGGKTRRRIEEATNAKLSVNSKSGEVEISAEKDFEEFRARDVVKAIARGFSPNKALLLANEEFALRILSLREIIGKSEKAIHQKKARVIGRSGTVREKIERETNCYISVHGNTISIIGGIEEIALAEEAVEMLLKGANIATVYERIRKRKLTEKKFEL